MSATERSVLEKSRVTQLCQAWAASFAEMSGDDEVTAYVQAGSWNANVGIAMLLVSTNGNTAACT